MHNSLYKKGAADTSYRISSFFGKDGPPPPNLHHLRCYLSDKIIYGVACQPDK